MEFCLKTLRGHSGSVVKLMQNDKHRFVRKTGNVERNLHGLVYLEGWIHHLPKILNYDEENEILDLEYIHGLDMKNYLLLHSEDKLIEFITDTIHQLSALKHWRPDLPKGPDWKDYTKIYEENLSWMDNGHYLPFSKEQLIKKLPKYIPETYYHGDMTLENIIFDVNKNRFVWIDCVTCPYKSFIFDFSKLRQDLDCRWFLRDYPEVRLETKLQNIKEGIISKTRFLGSEMMNDDYVLILMLLRVFRHCRVDTYDWFWIKEELEKLWK